MPSSASAARISGAALFGPVSTMAAREPTTITCEASIWGRTYSVSTAVMPSANWVRRGRLWFMGPAQLSKLLLASVMAVLAVTARGAVEERGNLVLDNVPGTETALTTQLEDYLNSRGASFVDWLPDGALLISTRFG